MMVPSPRREARLAPSGAAMTLPLTFEAQFGADDFNLYFVIREGRYALPLHLVFLAVMGPPVATLAVLRMSFEVLFFAIICIPSVLMVAFGRYPLFMGRNKRWSDPYLERHGAARGSFPRTFRMIVSITERGVTMRCGPTGSAEDDLMVRNMPWREWKLAATGRGAVMILCRAGQRGLLSDVLSRFMLWRPRRADLYEDVLIPARALGGLSAREVARELNRLIAANRPQR